MTDALVLLEVRGLEVHFPIRSGVFVDRQVGTVRSTAST